MAATKQPPLKGIFQRSSKINWRIVLVVDSIIVSDQTLPQPEGRKHSSLFPVWTKRRMRQTISTDAVPVHSSELIVYRAASGEFLVSPCS